MKAINDPIFYASFLVQFGGDLNSGIKAYCKKVNEPFIPLKQNSKRLGHFYALKEFKNGVFWFKDKRDLKTIAHECFHATYHIMEHIDVPLNDSTEEMFAYYLGWLIGEVLK